MQYRVWITVFATAPLATLPTPPSSISTPSISKSLEKLHASPLNLSRGLATAREQWPITVPRARPVPGRWRGAASCAPYCHHSRGCRSCRRSPLLARLSRLFVRLTFAPSAHCLLKRLFSGVPGAEAHKSASARVTRVAAAQLSWLSYIDLAGPQDRP